MEYDRAHPDQDKDPENDPTHNPDHEIAKVVIDREARNRSDPPFRPKLRFGRGIAMR